jgi:hypothetical protein
VALHEWIAPEGQHIGSLVRYDTVSHIIEYFNGFTELVDGPRQATDAEKLYDANAYPARPPAVPGSPVGNPDEAKAVMQTALNRLRVATADGVVTDQEIRDNYPIIVGALTSLRDLGVLDPELQTLTSLVRAQVMFAQFFNGNRIAAGVTALIAQNTSLRQDLQKLRGEFDAYTATHP